jgi:hypothetical protein
VHGISYSVSDVFAVTLMRKLIPDPTIQRSLIQNPVGLF